MTQVFSNNGSTTTTALVEVNDTEIPVLSGVVFPIPSGDEFFMATLEDNLGNMEIVRVTDVTTDTLSCVRAQEATVALEFPVGSRCEIRCTAGTLDQFIQRDSGVIDGGTY